MRTSRPSIMLAGWAALSAALAVGAGVIVVRAIHPLDGQFTGWQVVAVGAALASLCLVLAAAAAFLARRTARQVPGLVYLSVVPAVLLGLLAAAVPPGAVQPALDWASNHTRAAGHARAEALAAIAEGKLHPFVLHSHEPAATAGVAARMLQVGDLGSPWFPDFSPYAVALNNSADEGALESGRIGLVRSRRVPSGWTFDSILVETVWHFGTPAGAAGYSHYLVQRCGTCYAQGVTRLVGGVRILQADSGLGPMVNRYLLFRRGAWLWQVRFDLQVAQGQPLTAAEASRVTTAVVNRSA